MIQAIYPTLIYNRNADQSIIDPIQAEIDLACGDLVFSEGALQFQYGSTHLQISDSKGNQNIIQSHNLNKLEKYINSCMDEYLTSVASQPLPYNIHQSWMTKSGKGESAAVHAHGQFDISGVYYYKTNGYDGAIRFHNPNIAQEASKSWMRQHVVRIQPIIGTLVLFPGWLDHSVEVNNTNDYRMSLAFNITIDRSKLFGN